MFLFILINLSAKRGWNGFSPLDIILSYTHLYLSVSCWLLWIPMYAIPISQTIAGHGQLVYQAGYSSTFCYRNEDVSEPSGHCPATLIWLPHSLLLSVDKVFLWKLWGNSLFSYLATPPMMPLDSSKPLDYWPWVPPYSCIHPPTLSFPVSCTQSVTVLSCPVLFYIILTISFRNFLWCMFHQENPFLFFNANKDFFFIYHSVISKDLK